MYPLSWRLGRAGYRTYVHDYASLSQGADIHSQNLHLWLKAHHDPQEPINVVAHSLGGLVLRQFIAHHRIWQLNRCVTLGTPHQGSVCANYVQRYLPTLLGRAYFGALDGTCPPLPPNITLGVIAGNKPWGIGTPFLKHHNRRYRHSATATFGENDGTVYLNEALCPTAADTLILPVTHGQLLFDQTVAHQVIYFLEHGQFLHQ